MLCFLSQVMSKIRVVVERDLWEKITQIYSFVYFVHLTALNTVRFSALPVQSVSQFSDICLSLYIAAKKDRTGFYKENMSMETQRVLMDSAVGSVTGWCFTFIHFRGKKLSRLLILGFFGGVMGFLLLFCWFFYSRDCFFAAWEHKTPHISTDEILKSKSWKSKNLI